MPNTAVPPPPRMKEMIQQLRGYEPPDSWGMVAAAKARAEARPDQVPPPPDFAAAARAARAPEPLTVAERARFAPPDTYGWVAAAKAKKRGGAA